MAYSQQLREEEIKNKVAADVFGAYDCTRIFGAVDFCVSVKTDGPTLWETESLLWAEAKAGVRADLAPLFAQLVLTIGKEKTHEKHSPPPFLGAFDCEKIAFLPYHAVVDFFAVNDFDWTVAPSDPGTREFKLLLDRVRSLLAAQGTTFRFGETGGELAAFVKKNFVAGRDGTARLPVTRNNFVFVYNRWREGVKPSIAVDWDTARRRGILDADFFLADLLSKDNATLVEKLYVVLRGNHYELDRALDEMGLFVSKRAEFRDGQAAHAGFWNRYKRPPKKEFWHWIAERRDLLVPQDVRERKGSYFTPQIWVEKAQEALAAALGEDWQDEYDVWDCAAGTGNLLAGLSNKYKIWASTLDQADVEVMRERISNGANLLDKHIFQFDFLNDSFDKLPEGLREIVRDPKRRKKLVVFINPPYAEAGDAKQWTGKGTNKTDVAVTTATYAKYLPEIGLAGRELFAQFLIRIYREIPGCVIGQFSKYKHLQAPNFALFRQVFRPKLESVFLVRSNTFDNVKGKFPIGFFVWRTDIVENFERIEADVFANDGTLECTKSLPCYDHERGNIGKWLSSFADNESFPIGFMSNGRNDFQNQKLVYIINRKDQMPTPRGWHITAENVLPMCVFLAVRHCIAADWLNDRDQFLWPVDSWKEDGEFQMDSVMYALFHGQNRISCKAGVNHWIPFTEAEVGAQEAFRSHFMREWLDGRRGGTAGGPPALPDLFGERAGWMAAEGGESLSAEAQAVWEAGRELWRHYHSQKGAVADASFYDIRAHFQGFKPNGHMNADSPDETYTRLVGALREAQKVLAGKIAGKVREHGFLR